MNKWLLLAALSIASPASAQGLSVLSVVGEARANNPGLQSAMLQLESASWDLFGSEAQYVPVLAVNGSAAQQASSNVFGGFGGSSASGGSGSIRINTVRRADLNASLSKHLIWGTDLILTLGTYVSESKFKGGLGISPTGTGAMGVGSGLGAGMLLTSFASYGPLYSFSAKFEVKQALWKGRGRDVGEAAIQQSRVSRRASEHTRDRVSSELLRDLLTAYWELWYADAAIVIQNNSREVALRQRDEAQARVNSGSLAAAEVLTFDTTVATRDEDVLTARTEREARVHELARLIGDDQSRLSFEVLSDEPPEAQAFSRVIVEQNALANAAEVREQEAAVELARVQQKTADDPNKPQLDFDGYVQTQGIGLEQPSDAIKQFVSGDVITAFVGLSYQAPVNDRARRAAAAKARLATEVAEQNLRQTRQRVQSQVRGALDKEAAGEEKVRLAERTTEIAERQLVAEQRRYQSGSSTPIEVLQAENALRTAKLRLARARADWAESALILDHLTGDLLRRYAAR